MPEEQIKINSKENYKTRLVNELVELTIKLTKLETTLFENRREINKEQIELMQRQCEIMSAYQKILMDRIQLELSKEVPYEKV